MSGLPPCELGTYGCVIFGSHVHGSCVVERASFGGTPFPSKPIAVTKRGEPIYGQPGHGAGSSHEIVKRRGFTRPDRPATPGFVEYGRKPDVIVNPLSVAHTHNGPFGPVSCLDPTCAGSPGGIYKEARALPGPRKPDAQHHTVACANCGHCNTYSLGSQDPKEGTCTHRFVLDRSMGHSGKLVCTNCKLSICRRELLRLDVDVAQRYTHEGNTLADSASIMHDEWRVVMLENVMLRRRVEKLERDAKKGGKR